jgi:hypothetical protein
MASMSASEGKADMAGLLGVAIYEYAPNNVKRKPTGERDGQAL